MARTNLASLSPGRRWGGPAVLLLVSTLLVGCGGGDEDSSAGSATQTSSSASPPSSSASSPTDADGDGSGDGSGDGGGTDGDGEPQPPFTANTEPDVQAPSDDAFGNITDIRIGRHDGFDRVVFEFGGPGTPGWDVRYVDQAASQGSGATVDLPGDGALQVTITGVGLPPDTGVAEYSGPRRLSARDTETVTEVVFDGTFEGTTVAFVGTESEAPFRVYLLQDPARIVLEVADAS